MDTCITPELPRVSSLASCNLSYVLVTEGENKRPPRVDFPVSDLLHLLLRSYYGDKTLPGLTNSKLRDLGIDNEEDD